MHSQEQVTPLLAGILLQMEVAQHMQMEQVIPLPQAQHYMLSGLQILLP